MSAQTYLSDSAATADALSLFAGTLGDAGPDVTPAEARRLAPRLYDATNRVCALQRRLAAQRLADARLEAQRRAVVQPLAAACGQMRTSAQAARRGDVRVLTSAAEELGLTLGLIRGAAAG